LTPEDARRAALLALGGVQQARERQRDRRSLPPIENLVRDLRHGARTLIKSPGFTLAAIAILGLGIGANAAIFTVVNAVVLRPLPFQDADRVMRVWHTPPAQLFPGRTIFALSAANFLDWQTSNRSFERMAIYRGGRRTLTGQGEPEPVIVGRAPSDFFAILGLQPVLGRGFTAEEDREGAERTVILSDGFWRARFGADPRVIGRSLTLSGEPHTVVGVVTQPQAFVDTYQLWVPLALTTREAAIRDNHNWLAIAKLKPAVTVAAAQEELSRIAKRLELEYPADNKDWGALVRPLGDDLIGDARGALLLLLGAVGFVLVIACANLANLMLVRTHARGREIAVRSALGASRLRIVQQLLAEGLLLGAAGGAVGFAASYAGLRALIAALGAALPRAAEVAPDGRVLVFTAVLASVTGLARRHGA
jgi:predicted permease